jgi:hypothetical protein
VYNKKDYTMPMTFASGLSFLGGFTMTAALPSENTAAWFGGGTFRSTVDRITFATDTATASVRGPLSQARSRLAAAGNTTDGWFGGGYASATFSLVDRITYATDTATASVRGPLSLAVAFLAATGNTTAGWFGGGSAGPTDAVSRITYATDTATASVRGPLSSAKQRLSAAGNTTDGWFGGGQISGSASYSRSTVDRITYATDTATASVRGPLSSARYGMGAAGNSDYGWFGGGRDYFSGGYAVNTSTVNRITYATDTATASVRGPLSSVRYGMGAAGNTTDGWFGSGYQSSVGAVSTVDRITYATDTATASVRGPLSSARYNLAAAGGIQ